ncbi:DUF4234 domain-containing protein [Thermosipho atlanticus]
MLIFSFVTLGVYIFYFFYSLSNEFKEFCLQKRAKT